MRFIFLFILFVSIISCAVEKPQSIPGDQAMGLDNLHGENLMSATNDGSSLIIGYGHLFSVKAPLGWVIDTSSGAADGLPAVLYEEGSSWYEAPNIMYTQICVKEKNDTLESVIEQDINNYKKGYPNIVVKEKPDIVTAKGLNVMVKEFTGGAKSAYEAIAYFDEPKVVVMIVLTSFKKEDYESHYSSFNELVNSFNYFGEFGVPQESN